MKEKDILRDLLIRYPVLREQENNIWNAFQIMADCFEHGGKLLVAGNGGSAADAEHIVGELMKSFMKPRMLDNHMLLRLEETAPGAGRKIGEKLQGALPAVAVTGHFALSTAYANDVDPLYTFAQQVYGYGNEGDVFWGISTSGNSENILNACVVAKSKEMKTIGLTGQDGGKLKNLSDQVVIVPGEEVYEIQELHLPVYHGLCLMLEEYFFGQV